MSTSMNWPQKQQGRVAGSCRAALLLHVLQDVQEQEAWQCRIILKMLAVCGVSAALGVAALCTLF